LLNPTAATAFSEISVTLNKSPSLSGAVQSTPLTGVSGTTSFSLTCSLASDFDEPLTYQFATVVLPSTTSPGSEVFVDDTTTVLTSLTGRVPARNTAAYLPVGAVGVVCFSFDKFGARSSTSKAVAVAVEPLQSIVVTSGTAKNRTCALDDLIAATLTPAAAAAQPLAMMLQQVNSYVSSIAAADCVSTDCNVYAGLVAAVAAGVDAAVAADELTGDATVLVSQTLCVLSR
jgi:hypothetical protein